VRQDKISNKTFVKNEAHLEFVELKSSRVKSQSLTLIDNIAEQCRINP
jgi:hypothetical protein